MTHTDHISDSAIQAIERGENTYRVTFVGTQEPDGNVAMRAPIGTWRHVLAVLSGDCEPDKAAIVAAFAAIVADIEAP